MIDPRNTVILTAGIVADPELFNNSIAKFRIAIDYAGNEKNSKSNVGYFDVVYYLKDSDGNPSSKNAKFVAGQLAENKMKKGSQVQIVGRLVQDRWEQDGKKASKVVVVAEALTYASSGSYSKSDSAAPKAQATASASIPDEFWV